MLFQIFVLVTMQIEKELKVFVRRPVAVLSCDGKL